MMAKLRDFMHRLTTPIHEREREELVAFCAGLPTTPISAIEPRRRVRVAGQVEHVRTVPRAGAPTFEVSITDGHDRVLAVFLGRRTVPGMHAGRRLIIAGTAAPEGRIHKIVNPEYELLPSPRTS